jgi:hypothetical protein
MKVWDTVSLTKFYLFGSRCMFLTAEHLLQVRSAYPHFSAQETNIFILISAVHFCKPVATYQMQFFVPHSTQYLQPVVLLGSSQL